MFGLLVIFGVGFVGFQSEQLAIVVGVLVVGWVVFVFMLCCFYLDLFCVNFCVGMVEMWVEVF